MKQRRDDQCTRWMYLCEVLHHSTQCQCVKTGAQGPGMGGKGIARSYTCLDASCLNHVCAHFSFELHKPLRWKGQHVSCLHLIDEDPKACPGQDHEGWDQASYTRTQMDKVSPQLSKGLFGNWKDAMTLFCCKREWMLVLNPSSLPSQLRDILGSRNLWLQQNFT